jgi:hypothetical protein
VPIIACIRGLSIQITARGNKAQRLGKRWAFSLRLLKFFFDLSVHALCTRRSLSNCKT